MKPLRITALAAIGLTLLVLEGCSGGRDAARQVHSSAGHVAYAAEMARPETAPAAPRPTAPPLMSPAKLPSSGTADAADSGDESDETAWQTITTTLQRDGARKEAVLIVTVPRDDLFVAIEGMDVPTAAGVESVFSFYHCSCGKTSVIGQFCVADYESNDVIDALRAGHMEVASIAPMVLHSKVSPLLLRFQGEGKAGDLARTLREALRWTGKERMAPDVPLKGN